MKKFFTFIFAAALAVSCWGTETIQVGSGTGTTQNMPLVTGPWNYNHITQQLYLASEIGGTAKKGDISAISFYSKDFSAVYTSEYSDSRRTNFKIYISTVTSTVTTLSSWVDKGTEVYSSSQQTINSATWTKFEFSTDFTWNGSDNIVVTIVDNSNKRAGASAKNFYAFSANSRGLYATTSSGTTIDFKVTPTSASIIPQIKFEIETGGSTPTLTVPTSVSLGTFDKQYETASVKFVVKGTDLTNDVTISTESTDITISPTSITKKAIEDAGEDGVEVVVSSSSDFDFEATHTITVASTGATSQEVSVSGSEAAYSTIETIPLLYNTSVGSYSILNVIAEIKSVDQSSNSFVIGSGSNACTIDYSAVPGTYVAYGKVSNLKVKKTDVGKFKAFAFDYSATSITIDETNPSNPIQYGTTANVTLNRTLVEGIYNTICLPFNVSTEDIVGQFGASTEVKKLTSATLSTNDTELELNFADTTGMKAGVPYLIKPTSVNGENTYTFNGVTLDNNLRPTKFANLEFIGTFNKSDITIGDKDILLLGLANTLSWADDGNGFRGMRAYFKVKYHGTSAPASVSARMTFNNSQETTQLQEMSLGTQCCKMIKDGKLVIIRNGVLYNANGAKL